MRKSLPIFRFWAVLLLIGLLGACASTISASSFNRLSVGMTKSEVIATLGKPDSVRAGSGSEYLMYRTADLSKQGLCSIVVGALTLGLASAMACGEIGATPYFVQVVDGLVVAYGKESDVDIDLDIE